MSTKFDVLMYLYNYWSNEGDEYMKQLPLAGSPFYLIFSLCTIFIAVKVIEFLRRNSNPKDIRPVLIIYDGFLFGVFGVGFVMFFVASNFGFFLFNCSKTGFVYPIELNNELVTKHLVYTFIIMQVVSLGNQILISFGRSKTRALCVTSSRGTVTLATYWEASIFGDSMITMIHQTIWTIILAHYLIVNPIGETLFEPLVDCLNYVFYYGCGILLVTEPVANIKSSKKNKSSINEAISLKVKLREVARCACFCAISAHTFYLQSHEGRCHPPSSTGTVSNYHHVSAMVVSIYSAIFAAMNMIRVFTSLHVENFVAGRKGLNGKASTNLGNKYRRVTRLSKLAQ